MFHVPSVVNDLWFKFLLLWEPAKMAAIKAIVFKCLPRWFSMAFERHRSRIPDKWREYVRTDMVLNLKKHLVLFFGQSITTEALKTKLNQVNRKKQLFPNFWSFLRSMSQLTGIVNFDWVNSWKRSTLASKNVSTRLEKWRATWNAFNSKTGQH